MEFRKLSLGEVIDGDRMAMALYDVKFKETFEHKLLCTVTLDEEQVHELTEAVEDLYYFEFSLGTYVLL